MLWFTQKVLRRVPGAWTFVMVTDRTELDDQLHGEFADAGVISKEAQVHATDSAAHLRELLAADHRYVFTLIHKFRLTRGGETTMPVLSDRSDVIVITDEAHRSQYDTLALNMRQALPNAAFMGFTGTPLIAGEELTRQRVRRLRQRLQLPRRHRGRRDGPALLREPHPRAAARQRGLRRRARPRCWRRPSSTRTPKGGSPAGSAGSTR